MRLDHDKCLYNEERGAVLFKAGESIPDKGYFDTPAGAGLTSRSDGNGTAVWVRRNGSIAKDLGPPLPEPEEDPEIADVLEQKAAADAVAEVDNLLGDTTVTEDEGEGAGDEGETAPVVAALGTQKKYEIDIPDDIDEAAPVVRAQLAAKLQGQSSIKGMTKDVVAKIIDTERERRQGEEQAIAAGR